MKWGAGLCRFFVGFVAMVCIDRKVRTGNQGKKNLRSWVTRAEVVTRGWCLRLFLSCCGKQ